MRDFRRIDHYLNVLLADIYPQPLDKGHTDMTGQVIFNWVTRMDIKSVLDVGCGQGVAYPFFREVGVDYTGIALGEDVGVCLQQGIKVQQMDFHFLEFPDNSFDMVFSRHSLEHSPMPLLALMEWERVARDFLCVILPNPEWFKWSGLNHYSVMHPNQIEFLMDRSGWNVMWSDFTEPQELRYMCEKKRKSHYDMFIEAAQLEAVPV